MYFESNSKTSTPKMPIPNSNRKIAELVSISIENETILAKCDRDTRFSYIKKSLVKDQVARVLSLEEDFL